MVVGLDVRYAVPLSMTVITGMSVMNSIIFIGRRHPFVPHRFIIGRFRFNTNAALLPSLSAVLVVLSYVSPCARVVSRGSDYPLLSLLAPALFAGVSIGVALHMVLPPWLTMGLLVSVLIVVIVRLTQRVRTLSRCNLQTVYTVYMHVCNRSRVAGEPCISVLLVCIMQIRVCGYVLCASCRYVSCGGYV